MCKSLSINPEESKIEQNPSRIPGVSKSPSIRPIESNSQVELE